MNLSPSKADQKFEADRFGQVWLRASTFAKFQTLSMGGCSIRTRTYLADCVLVAEQHIE
jgi:hypothetical protein